MGGMCDHDAVPVIDRAGLERGDAPQIGPGFSTEIFCGAMVGFLESRDQAKPFFGWLALTSPHDPRTPPAEFRAKYDAARLTLPVAYAREPKFDNGELEVRDEKLLSKPLADDQIREDLANYYGMISHHDDQLGRVFAVLRETGQEENTLVVYIGDHGLAMGRHGLLGKQNLYEHSTRVPLIIAGPGVVRGAVSNGLVYSLDISATLWELGGIAAPEGLESISLGPQLRSPETEARPELFGLYKDCQRMLRDSEWKLIEYQVAGQSMIELFNLQDDPDELNNLGSEPRHAGRIHAMRQRLHAWQERLGDEFMTLNLEAAPLAACS